MRIVQTANFGIVVEKERNTLYAFRAKSGDHLLAKGTMSLSPTGILDAHSLRVTLAKRTQSPSPNSYPGIPFIAAILPKPAIAAVKMAEVRDRLDARQIFRLLVTELPLDPEP